MAGEVGKPHGLRGEVYVVPISDDPRRFDAGAELLHQTGRTLRVESSRRHGNRLLVKFEGVDDRDAAEVLRGALFVGAEQLRELAEDEFWEHEVVGCRVELPSGTEVGQVSRVVPGAAHDLLAVETERGERLVPLVAEIVRALEPEAGRVVVDPPEGLLD